MLKSNLQPLMVIGTYFLYKLLLEFGDQMATNQYDSVQKTNTMEFNIHC